MSHWSVSSCILLNPGLDQIDPYVTGNDFPQRLLVSYSVIQNSDKEKR
jgi:hypothetical protein